MIEFDGVYTVRLHIELDENDYHGLVSIEDLKENMKKFPDALKKTLEDEMSDNVQVTVTCTDSH